MRDVPGTTQETRRWTSPTTMQTNEEEEKPGADKRLLQSTRSQKKIKLLYVGKYENLYLKHSG